MEKEILAILAFWLIFLLKTHYLKKWIQEDETQNKILLFPGLAGQVDFFQIFWGEGLGVCMPHWDTTEIPPKDNKMCKNRRKFLSFPRHKSRAQEL